jgi:hypothetical protein
MPNQNNVPRRPGLSYGPHALLVGLGIVCCLGLSTVPVTIPQRIRHGRLKQLSRWKHSVKIANGIGLKSFDSCGSQHCIRNGPVAGSGMLFVQSRQNGSRIGWIQPWRFRVQLGRSGSRIARGETMMMGGCRSTLFVVVGKVVPPFVRLMMIVD